MTSNHIRVRIKVKGIVQGVGFRPAMSKQASAMGLTGKVCNTRDSVEIEIQGAPEKVSMYVDHFNSFTPENAVISFFASEQIPAVYEEKIFSIIESRESGPTRFSIPPDIAMCDSCRREFYDPMNRRHLYPFITCGNCGPRYTYMKDMPYDREKTSMYLFPFCDKCRNEYDDPSDRRYHIEGFSCPVCGPRVEGLDETIDVLLKGGIAAIKGLGGYNIACSAVNFGAVQKLRDRKRRPGKPFAVMFRDTDAARKYVLMNNEEETLLASKVSPIVIVKKRDDSDIAENIAPGNGYLGIMIAYTPLHQMILDRVDMPLVMTSANISGDPLIIDDAKAESELADIVDVFLTHNRAIYKRADDSISYIHNNKEISVRMGRGKMPFPVKLPEESGNRILAVGAELKSNISVVSDDNIVTSNHIGDLGTPETFSHFSETVKEMRAFYDLRPDIVVADLHPDYESTTYAKELAENEKIKLVQVQHHYSHFLSCYFENMLKGKATGIIFDGTGYGTDGTIWGGEIFTGDIHSFQRRGRLSLFPLPGGEKAIREPWRILSGLLDKEKFFDSCGWVDRNLLENIYGISGNTGFSPLTSSAGRLFDAAAALLGFHKNVSFEAEAAIYLEMLAMKSDCEEHIPVVINNSTELYEISSTDIINKLYERKKTGGKLSDLAMIFHNTLIEGVSEMTAGICSKEGLDRVLLSGGVFQNRIMLDGVEKKLASMGLDVFINRKIPSNDAGISAGQAIYGVYNA